MIQSHNQLKWYVQISRIIFLQFYFLSWKFLIFHIQIHSQKKIIKMLTYFSSYGHESNNCFFRLRMSIHFSLQSSDNKKKNLLYCLQYHYILLNKLLIRDCSSLTSTSILYLLQLFKPHPTSKLTSIIKKNNTPIYTKLILSYNWGHTKCTGSGIIMS